MDERKSNTDWLLRQQTALAKFGELTLRSDDLDQILTEACRIVGAALGTDLAKVVALQPDGHTLKVIAGVGWLPGVIGQATIEVADDTSEGVALKTGVPLISPNISLEKRFRYPPFLIENNVKAVSNVVILGEEGEPPFGILQVDCHEPHEFTVEDTAFLSTYANVLAAAVIRFRANASLAARTRELMESNAKLQAEAEERARVEHALHQSQKMEAVGQLTGGLAHDFNNLLMAISGSLEMVRICTIKGQVEDQDRYIGIAIDSTHRAAALTHRLLAFSRRETLDPEATGLNRLVQGMADLFRRTVGPPIHIETHLAPTPWLTFCDPNQLESALLNLVINARDAMPEGGVITIETANVAVGERSDKLVLPMDLHAGDYVVLSVADTGCGMPPDIVARAFDPFFTTKPIGQGTGLGLSMIHGFVQQSGGHVLLRSEEGHGTVVTFYMPRHFGPLGETIDAKVVPLRPAPAASVILLVEDEASIRTVVLDLLSGLGYEMLHATTGPDGLAILEKAQKIDLLITDVGLPGLNGRQLADAAGRIRPALKVLFISGYAEYAFLDRTVSRHGMQIIAKPFALDVFAARVQGMLA